MHSQSVVSGKTVMREDEKERWRGSLGGEEKIRVHVEALIVFLNWVYERTTREWDGSELPGGKSQGKRKLSDL